MNIFTTLTLELMLLSTHTLSEIKPVYYVSSSVHEVEGLFSLTRLSCTQNVITDSGVKNLNPA